MSSFGYIQPVIDTNADDLAAAALDTLIATFPGFVPWENHLESWMIEVVARMVAEARDVASRVPTAIFRYFGKALLGLPSIDAAAATIPTTWTAIDALGYTVAAGTVAAFPTAGDVLVPFEVVSDVVIPPGVLATDPGAVLMRALDLGSSANDLTGPMTLINALAWVVSVVADGVSSNGVDAESDDAYLNRLANELQLLAPRPILPADFAVLAKNTPGIARALAVDGYNPADGTMGNARMVAVAVVDAAGHAVGGVTKAALAANLEALREANFIVNVFDPTFTPINVTTTFSASPAFDVVALEAAVVAAITAYISPANWAGGDQNPPQWNAGSNVVRYLELATVINNIAGVNYVETLTVNGGVVDVNLAGTVGLPTVGAVVATAA